MLGRFPKGNSVSTSVKESIAVLFQLLDEELDVIDHADNPHLFFLAYEDAVKYCGKILSYKPGKQTDSHILEILHHLYGDKTEITNRFLDRLSTSGRLSYDVDAIIDNRDEMTEASYDYFLSLTGLDELRYTYCTVTFGGTHTYDYICEIPGISVGDDVIVPVGAEETEKMARVIAIKEYRHDEVPYPVAKTKRIIAKYGCGL